MLETGLRVLFVPLVPEAAQRERAHDWPAVRAACLASARAAPLPPPPRPLGQLPTDCACYFSRHYFVKGHGHLDYDGDDAFLPDAVVAPLRAERTRRLANCTHFKRAPASIGEELVEL